MNRSYECTVCGTTITFQQDQLVASLSCPGCKKTFRIARKTRKKEVRKDEGTKSPLNPNKFTSRGRRSPVLSESQAKSSATAVKKKSAKTGLSPQEARIFAERNQRTDQQTLQDPIENFKKNIYPRELKEPFKYPNHWTFEIAVSVNVVLSIFGVILYLALVGSLAFSICYHIYSNIDPIREAAGSDLAIKLGIFLILLLLGVSTLVFLAKPMFVNTLRPIRRKLTRSSEPLLFKFVDTISTYCGTSAPTEIECSHLSKTKARGTSEDIVLTLGLHEIGTWNTRQFAHRLAYIFATQAQVSEYKSLRMLQSLVDWWDRSADRYDVLDYRIMSQSSDEMKKKMGLFKSLVTKPFILSAWFCSAACRKLIQFFRFTTRRLCSSIFRQINTASEEAASSIVGADGVRSFYVNEKYVEKCLEKAKTQFSIARGTSGEVKDFSVFLSNFREILGDIESEIDAAFSKERTSSLAYDQCPRVQIERAEKRNEEGLYVKEFPASSMFMDFPASSRRATRDLRQDVELWGWDTIAE